MVFRSRRRADMSQAVAEGTERLELLVREQREALERVQATLLDSVAVTRREMELREGDLVEVLELVSELCRHAIDVVEADREEHREFLASFAEAVRPMIEASGSMALGAGAPSADGVRRHRVRRSRSTSTSPRSKTASVSRRSCASRHVRGCAVAVSLNGT